jgi:hypothetical protein
VNACQDLATLLCTASLDCRLRAISFRQSALSSQIWPASSGTVSFWGSQRWAFSFGQPALGCHNIDQLAVWKSGCGTLCSVLSLSSQATCSAAVGVRYPHHLHGCALCTVYGSVLPPSSQATSSLAVRVRYPPHLHGCAVLPPSYQAT